MFQATTLLMMYVDWLSNLNLIRKKRSRKIFILNQVPLSLGEKNWRAAVQGLRFWVALFKKCSPLWLIGLRFFEKRSPLWDSSSGFLSLLFSAPFNTISLSNFQLTDDTHTFPKIILFLSPLISICLSPHLSFSLLISKKILDLNPQNHISQFVASSSLSIHLIIIIS